MLSNKKLYIIFISAVIIKLLLVLFFNKPETFESENIADNILAGRGFLYIFLGTPYRSFVQPFYPILTALVYYLTNQSHIAMLVLQCITSSLLCFIVYFIAVRLGGAREALIAGFLTAFHPGLTVYSIFKLHTLVFDTFFYILSICLILRFIEKPNIKNAILAGVIFGFAALSRSTILPFLIFTLFFLLYILKALRFRTRVKYAIIICVSAFLVYFPWIIRNYKVFHQVVLMQTGTGENLWTGNNIEASGSAILPSGASVHEKKPEKMQRELANLDELGQKKYYTDFLFSFIKEQPALFFKLFLKKFYYFWWFSPQAGVLYNSAWTDIYKIYYGIMVIFSVLGLNSLLKNRKNRQILFILFVFMLSISLIHAVANVDTRHRWTVEPVIIIMASIGMSRVFEKFYSVIPK